MVKVMVLIELTTRPVYETMDLPSEGDFLATADAEVLASLRKCLPTLHGLL